MKIGKYNCISVETGRFALDGGAMFGVVPKVLWQKKFPADELNRIPMVTRSLLIQGQGRVILVDTGAGDKWSPKEKAIYKIDQESVNLMQSLENAGIHPSDITDVILTHLHFDHTGGSTIFANEGIRPAFPNAIHWIQKRHWELATKPTPKDKASFPEINFRVLEKSGLVKFLEGENEIYEGIKLLISNGHTEAQQHPLIEGGGRNLFYCGDLIPTSAHIPIPWVMAYDNFPLTTIEEKKSILSRALKANWILFFEHDPFVTACTLKEGKHGIELGETIKL